MISRKEFLTHGLFAFGRELTAGINSENPPVPEVEVQGGLLFYSSRCFGRTGGCFSCIEHCPKEAITMNLGSGISVDAASCDGCGECTGFCPAEPKAIILNSRQAT